MEKNKIVILATYENGLTQAEAIIKAKEQGLRILTNKEVDTILQDDKLREKYSDCFPCWTGTKITYGKENGYEIEEDEKKYMMDSLPKEDGWYLPDHSGIPSGAKSNYDNPKARYLWRLSSNNSLVARCCGVGYNGGDGRGVSAGGGHDGRFGVLAEKIKAGKNVDKNSEYQRGYEQGFSDCDKKIQELLKR